MKSDRKSILHDSLQYEEQGFESLLYACERLLSKDPMLERNFTRELKRFLALCPEEFVKRRSYKTVLRLVFSATIYREEIFKEIRLSPERRHFFARLLCSKLSFPFGSKNVLGLILVAHLPDRYDFFDEQHVYLALQELVPSLQIVPDSIYFSRNSHDKLLFLYVEIEKSDTTPLTLQEYKILKTRLIPSLRKRIERMSPSILMPQNTEEMFKNILILGGELHSSEDLPQVAISLEKQTLDQLIFSITLARVLTKGQSTIDQLSSITGYRPEKTQIIGYLKNGAPKEASIFQLHLPRALFLRTDSSANFYDARKKVVAILQQALGDFRDYNGGIFLKQGEALSALKETLSSYSTELIEDLFYSITPLEMQVILPPSLLKSFMTAALKTAEEGLHGHISYQLYQTDEGAFVIVQAHDFSLRAFVEKELEPHLSVCSFSLAYQEKLLAGYLCLTACEKQQGEFIHRIQKCLRDWEEQKKGLNLIRLYNHDWPYSLDPRLGGDTHSTVVLKALFEGLTRCGKDGCLALAMADGVTISEDLKRYTFHLRKSYWTNGDRVVAQDFEYAWKKVLSPELNSSFVYLFDSIKNAQLIKEGKKPVSSLGVHCLNEETLLIELQAPCPYFLELLSHVIFSPINHRVDKNYPNWFTSEGSSYVCNGPFLLLRSDLRYGRYELIKNPFYWDKQTVQLDKIVLIKADVKTAFEMFKKDEIDWLGRPASPWDDAFSPYDEFLQSSSSYTVYWYVFNVQCYPFHNKNLRKAIACTIDRKKLLPLHPLIGVPSVTPLPKTHSQFAHLPIPDCSPEEAVFYFEKALKELRLSRDQFPPITLTYPEAGTRYQMANTIKQSIEQILKIHCRIEIYPWKEFFTKMTRGQCQFGSMGWTALVNDPFYTLNAFKHADEGINFAKWEDSQYKSLLTQASLEHDLAKRRHYLAECEALLIEETPIIPIYYEFQQYVKKDRVVLPANREIKDFDFKWMSIKK